MPAGSTATKVAPPRKGRARRRRAAGSAPPRDGSAPPRDGKLPRVDVIFNPVSGTGDPDEDRAEIQEMLSRGYDAVNFHETTPDVSAPELAARALEDGAKVLVASGGDGTVTGVADAIMKFVERGGNGASAERSATALEAPESEDVPEVETAEKEAQKNGEDEGKRVGRHGMMKRDDGTMPAGVFHSELPRLGVIPRGTANAFCAALGIPSTIEGSATLINRATARSVDLARINGRDAMFMQCGVGLEAGMIKKADRTFKNSFGLAAYTIAGVQSVAEQTTFNVEILLSDIRHRIRTGGVEGAELTSAKVTLTGKDVAAVTIANSAPPSSALAQGIGDVRPDDGLLEVVCMAPSGRVATVTSVMSMLKAALLRQRGTLRPEIYGLRARRVELKCDPPQKVVVDGEVAGETPIVVELAEDPRARQILVVAPKAGKVTRERRRLSRALVRGIRNARGIVLMSGLIWGIRFMRGLQNNGQRSIASGA